MVVPVEVKVEESEVMTVVTAEVVMAVAKRVSELVVEPALSVMAEVVNGRRPS